MAKMTRRKARPDPERNLKTAERAEQERAREKMKELQEQRESDIEERIDWRKTVRWMIRREFRKEGIRVR